MKNLLWMNLLILTSTCLHAQNVGIGTNTPAEKLDVAGNVRMSGEIKPGGIAGEAGQVLISNGNGTMQWAMSTSGNEEGNGGWGDCSIYNIGDFNPVANDGASPGDNFGRAVSISGEDAIVGAQYDDAGISDGGSATIFHFNAMTGEWEDQGKLLNPNGGTGDGFGSAVAISGDYAIVGAYNDNENNMAATGSATVFKRDVNTGVWQSEGKLTNINAAVGDNFGYAVAISGDYALVGAYNDDEFGHANCGSATIFKRNPGTQSWTPLQKFLNPNAAPDDAFGLAVALSGDYAIVGAYKDDEGPTNDNGSVTIFKRNVITGVWTNQAKIFDPDGFPGDRYGIAVAMNGDLAIVGISGYYLSTGAAEILKRNPVTDVWEPQARLTNPGGEQDDNFGNCVSIAGDYAMVGGTVDDENGVYDSGAVTIFKQLSEGMWFPHQKFTCPYATSQSFFGTVSITTEGNRFVTGARGIINGKGMAFFGTVR